MSNYDSGALKQETLSAGQTPLHRNYSYNSPGWLKTITDPVFVNTINYTKGGFKGAGYYSGLIAGESIKLAVTSPGSFLTDLEYAFSYDDLKRVTTSQCMNNGSVVASLSMGTQQPVQYDNNGNLLTVESDGTSQKYTYEKETNFAINTDGTSQHDLQRGELGEVIASKSRNISDIKYDLVSSRTDQLTLADSTTRAFTYDQYGMRLAATETGGTRLYLRSSTSRIFVDSLVGPGGATTNTEFIYGLTGAIGFIRDSKRYLVLPDRLGSTRAVLGPDGTVIAAYHYAAFGELAKPTYGQSDITRRLYTGYELDAETGLYNAHARLFDPRLRRFYSVDPQHQYSSPYVYAGNNPIVLVDPTGEFSIGDFFIGLALAVVGVISIVATAGADTPAVVAAGGIFGGAVVGAGVSGISYSVTADHFGGAEFGSALGIGAATGLVTSGAAVGLAAATDAAIAQSMARLGTEFGENLGARRGHRIWQGSNRWGRVGLAGPTHGQCHRTQTAGRQHAGRRTDGRRRRRCGRRDRQRPLFLANHRQAA